MFTTAQLRSAMLERIPVRRTDLADDILADDHIGPEHLLLGLLRENGAAAAVLVRPGVTIDLAHDEVLRQSRSRSVSE